MYQVANTNAEMQNYENKRLEFRNVSMIKEKEQKNILTLNGAADAVK